MPMIEVRHNIEVAHRLSELPGKCDNIHGHSMWVTLQLYGDVNSKGILEGLEFGDVKKAFREYLDTNYDHHLLLNTNDPWARKFVPQRDDDKTLDLRWPESLPGLMTFPGDPTTENLARWISEWAQETFKIDNFVKVQETHVNAAAWESFDV